MLEAIHEIAIYIHRFHNLDLFQQGWYQIKVTLRCEDSDDHDSFGIPSRVVQYEAPDLGPADVSGVWRINDKDHSFSTQPFRIKYAKQDIFLSMMVAFNMSLSDYEGASTPAVIMRFELMYAPVLENGSTLQASLDGNSAAVHEFRVLSKALLGMHAYCPVYFDVFHSVLVDLSVHVSLRRTGPYASSLQVPSDVYNDEGAAAADGYYTSKQGPAMLVKAFLTARDVLAEDLRTISRAINQSIILPDFASMDQTNMNTGVLAKAYSEKWNGFEKPCDSPDLKNDGFLHSLPKDELVRSFLTFGNQTTYLWAMFLRFHRANKTKILDFLRQQWAIDRRSEWSIWMVYSKVGMPHQYISAVGDSSNHNIHGRSPVPWKLTDDPAQTAAMRAELHRRSIGQMRINNRSILDLQIFGDPSRVPVIFVERATNTPLHSATENSYFSDQEQKSNESQLAVDGFRAKDNLSAVNPAQSGRALKIVVFVHGFQGHHLDLRLVRNQWLLFDPKVEFLMSEVNEEKTTGDIREMGARLAQEVVDFVKKKMDKITRSGSLRSIKISFVGHSIGNVILRSALAESIMEPYLGFLWTYVSVSGPHLGYLYSSNSLFNSGLWLLKKLKSTLCIHQLTFSDDSDLRKTFLYKLCKQKTLQYFKNIFLLSSPQDGYVPYHSARIEMCPASSGDNSKKSQVLLEMLNNCLDQIRSPSSEQRVFIRCDVNFDVTLQGRSLDTIIGRAAHIEFLETDTYVKFIMWSFPELFR